MFKAIGKVDAICIATNGYVTKKNKCVMGAGCAKQAKLRWTGIDTALGNGIMTRGNIVLPLVLDRMTAVYSFPVKPSFEIFYTKGQISPRIRATLNLNIGDIIPGWACYANLDIITKSAQQLVEVCDRHKYKTIIVPRPGCGCGGLLWSEVRPILEYIFDDRFCVVTNK